MEVPRIAVISFPGNNCEVESMRAIRQAGMAPLFFRWNADRAMLDGVDGYFIPGGFAYEDRGRSGMVAARDPLMEFIGREAENGKVVIGNCNGAQILVESGLIPLGDGLRMSLARNAILAGDGWESPGFLSQWVWIAPTCAPDRCATSDWKGTMHLPIAHGEGRFTTKDPDLIAELRASDQIAFSYCDAQGCVSDDPVVTPNGSMHAIAGICNPAGNVVALMPHPERTENGAPYFAAMKRWIEDGKVREIKNVRSERLGKAGDWNIPHRAARPIEIFIDTIIVNNEERTVEQAARRFAPTLRLKQWKYFALPAEPGRVLTDLSAFNPNKERAFLRRNGSFTRWRHDVNREEPVDAGEAAELLPGIALLRRDEPDTGASAIGPGGETGVCYVCSGAPEPDVLRREVLEIFANPHASRLERIA